MQKNKILKIIFIVIAAISVISNLLMGLAIYFYPGGNFKDHNEEGFDELYGALSDLGRITAYNGEPNLISRILYQTAIVSLSLAVMVFYSIIWTFFQKEKFTKWMSRGGSILGITQGILYIIFAFSPADIAFSRHIMLIYVSPGFLIGTILVYTIVFFMSKSYFRVNAFSFLFLLIIAAMFATAVTIGSFKHDIVFHASRRLGHTLFNFIVTFNYGIQALGAYIYVKKLKIS